MSTQRARSVAVSLELFELLYDVDINSLSDSEFVNIFHSFDFHFILLIVSFAVHKILYYLCFCELIKTDIVYTHVPYIFSWWFDSIRF